MHEAFKNPEFLKLFEQYAADISSQEVLLHFSIRTATLTCD